MPAEVKYYKMNGPALLPKSQEEVKQTVDEKLVFVTKQIDMLDK
jgi:chaperonin cofactor prefoldin